jgi:hypothetical protein
MQSISPWFFIVLGFLVIIGSRLWQQKYIDHLSEEFKGKLAIILRTRNKWLNYLSIASMILFTVLIFSDWIEIRNSIFVFTGINVLLFTVSANLNYNKFINDGFPHEFMVNFIQTTVMRIIGLTIVFSYLLF